MARKNSLIILLMIICIIPLSSAVVQLQETGGTYSEADAYNGEGARFITKSNGTITQINYSLQAAEDGCLMKVCSYSGTTIISCFYNASVNTSGYYIGNITLENNTNYAVIFGETGGCDLYYAQPSVPISLSLINYTGGVYLTSQGVYTGLTMTTAAIYALTAVYIEDYTTPAPPSNLANITYNANTTSNASTSYYLTANNIYVSAYASDMTGTLNISIRLYNSSGLVSLVSGAANFSHNFSNLPAGAYYFNASVNNGTSSINTTTRTSTIYDFYVNSSYSAFSTNLSLNITYTGNTTPSSVGLDYFVIQLLNSDFSLNKTLISNNTLSLTANINSYSQRIDDGNYYIKILAYDRAGNSKQSIGQQINLSYGDYLSTGTANFSYADGFVTALNTTISYSCINGIDSSVNITSIFNDDTYMIGNHSSGTAYTNESVLSDGINTLNLTCYDWRTSDSTSLSRTIYSKNICLIDERTNAVTDVWADGNITGAKVYYDDNSTLYDFKVNNVSCKNFTSPTAKLRFQIDYYNGLIVTRYIDVSLSGEELRVCANNGELTYYEQDMISASQTPAILKSVYANCLIAADYTRFAYQNAYLLKASTIDGLYYLYTYSAGVQTYLASVDGSISTYINLDNIEFNAQSFDVDLLGDTLGFYNNGTSNTTSIYYKSQRGDNKNISVIIIRMDTSETLLSTSDFTNPNEFSILFDYSTLSGVNASTIFKISVYRTLSDDTSETTIRYFTTSGKSGLINTTLAVIVSVMLLIFGLTFASTKITFSWFGIIIIIAAIAVLALAIMAWYVLFLMAIEVILLVYMALVLVFQGKNSLVGGLS